MRPFYFFVHLLSLNSLNSLNFLNSLNSPSFRHIVIGTNTNRNKVDLDHYFHLSPPDIHKISFSFQDNDDIYLPKLMETLDPISRPIPTYHIFSKYHFQRFQSSPFSSKMSYANYCLWEEKVADIVFSYLGDLHHQWIIQLPAFFLYHDAIKSYGERDVVQHTLWITPSVDIGSPDMVLFDEKMLDSKFI
uniref:Uncharacterized protein n=1 Tax=viral metagenome TaxID=1070528 RepID=A0A6C0CZN7_9ZZZZ